MTIYKQINRANLLSYLAIVCTCLIFSSNAIAQQVDSSNCQLTNASLQAMGKAIVEFNYMDGSHKEIEVKLADTNRTRAAGFQNVCAKTIAKQAILFTFSAPLKARFHMRNVKAPIDIAFIKANGKIDSIQAMQPYVLGSLRKPLYNSKDSVIAALETYPGFYTEHKIDDSVQVSWRPVVTNN